MLALRWVAVLLLVVQVSGAGTPKSNASPIALQPEQLPFSTKEFYLADVLDERPDTKTIGLVVPVAGNGVPQSIDLEGGSAAAIKKYIKESFSHNTAFRPIVMRLKEYQVTEKATSATRVEGQIQIWASFEVRREGKLHHLFDYKSGARYARPANNLSVVEPTLRRTLSQSLSYLTTWVQQEAPGNEKLAHTLKVTFEEHLKNTNDDTLFYDPKKPLTWQDFQGGSRLTGSFAASIFPGISNDVFARVENGVLHVRVISKPYVLRGLSKVRPTAKTPYTLNHEQRHFDIVKLVSEHYKQRLRPEKLTLEDYESQIKYQYLETLWEMDRLQKQYDGETHHGQNEAAQARWNQKIDVELRALKVQ